MEMEEIWECMSVMMETISMGMVAMQIAEWNGDGFASTEDQQIKTLAGKFVEMD